MKKIIVDLSVGYADRVAVLFIFEQIQIPCRYKILCKPKENRGKEFFTSIDFLKKLRAQEQNRCALFFAGFYPELVEGFQLRKSKK